MSKIAPVLVIAVVVVAVGAWFAVRSSQRPEAGVVTRPPVTPAKTVQQEKSEPKQPDVALTPVQIKEVDANGTKCIQMENAFVRLLFQPKGGKCISFVYKPTGEELASKYGVFEEHAVGQSYLRSDFRRAVFTIAVAANDGNKCEVSLSAVAVTPEMAGVKLTKKISLRKDSSAVQAEYEMSNGSAENKNLGFWFHNAFSNAALASRYFTPSTQGVKSVAYDSKGKTAEETTKDPSRAWTAAVIGKSGVACISDYEKLDYFFNYMSDLYADIEWREVAEKVKPGESKKATARILAFGGLESVGGAGDKFVGEISGPGQIELGKSVKFTLNIFAVEQLTASAETYWRMGNERIRQSLGRKEIKLTPGQIAKIPVDVSVPAVGSCIVGAELSVDGKPIGDVLRVIGIDQKPGRVFVEPAGTRLATKPALPEGRMDVLYSLDVPTRHVPWGRPYYKGTMKIFVLSPITPNGDTTELLKRFDTNYRIVSCDWSWEMNTWGMGDHYGARSNKDAHGRDLELGYMTEDLTSSMPFDVMVIPTVIGWNFYPERAREAIMNRVNEGAGLVLITPQNEKDKPADSIVLPNSPISVTTPTNYHWYGDWQRHNGMSYGSAWTPQGRHFITQGLPLKAIPFANIGFSQATAPMDAQVVLANDKGVPIIAVKQSGKGRIVAINWYANQRSSLTPDEKNDPRLPNYDYWEYFYSVLGRACLWAAGMEPNIDVKEITADKDTYEPAQVASGKVTLALENRTRALPVDVEATFKNEFGKVEKVTKLSKELKPGSNTIEIALPADLSGGAQICDVIVKNSGYSINWGSAFFRVTQLVKVESVKVQQEAIKNGQNINGSAKFTCRQAGKGQVVFELRDPYDRLLGEISKDADFNADFDAQFDFKVDNWLALVGFVRARAVIGGKTAYQADSNLFVVTPVEPSFTDYEVVPWGFEARRNLWDVKAAQFRKMGATALGDISEMGLRCGFGAKGNIDPGTLGIYFFSDRKQALEDRWNEYKKSDHSDVNKKRLLVRDNCFSRDAVRQNEHKRIEERAKSQVKYNPGSYYIGDESSLTSYGMEAELCYTDECLANFQKWLKERYADINALNTKWKTQYKDWSEIIPPTIIEAQAEKKYVPWAEHRTFMEWLYADNLRFIREELKKIDPVGEGELTGTQAPTSFNAMDWARHMDHVKRFVPYSGNFMWDMCRCFSDGVKMVSLTGYGSKGDGVKNSLWLQAFQGLVGVNIFWEWSLVDADMTLSQNAEDIGEVFRELRGDGIGRLISTCKWQPNDIAVHFSMPSIHAARLLDKEGFPTQCRNGWCQLAQDLHYQFDMISYLQVEKGLLSQKGYKILILPDTLAISPKEVAEMKKFVEAGGTIIADVDCGKFDDKCDSIDVLAGLIDVKSPGVAKSVGKGKTIYLGKTVEWYPGKRLDAEGIAARKEVDKLFADNGAKRRSEVRLTSGELLPRSEVFNLDNGTMKLTCVLKENLGGIRKTSADGVEYFIPYGDDFQKPVEKTSIKLPAKAYIYDVRARKYIGNTDTIEDTIVSAEAKMYSQLSYKVDAVETSLPDKVKCGETVTAVAKLATSGGPAPGTHVFNMKVFDPKGERVFYYDRNFLASNGSAPFVLPIAVNAGKGDWKVVLRDVASGVEATKTIAVGE